VVCRMECPPLPWEHHEKKSPFVRWAEPRSMGLMLASLPTAASGAGARLDAACADQMQVDTPCACAAGSSTQRSAAPQTRSSAAAAAAAAAAGASSSCEDAMMAEQQAAATRPAPRNPADAPMRKLSVSLIDTYKLINQVCTDGWLDGLDRLFEWTVVCVHHAFG